MIFIRKFVRVILFGKSLEGKFGEEIRKILLKLILRVRRLILSKMLVKS